MEWSKKRATFHAKHGRNITLSTSGSVATRATKNGANLGHAVAFTEDTFGEGDMLRVAVLGYKEECGGGLGIFFTTEKPEASELTSSSMAAKLDAPGQAKLIGVYNNKIFYRGRPLGTRHNLARPTDTVTEGHSVGIRLVDGNKLQLYYDSVLTESFQFERPYPQEFPMWGVVDVYGKTLKVKADIWTPKPSNPPRPKNLMKSATVNYPLVKQPADKRVPEAKKNVPKPSIDNSNIELMQKIEELQKLLDKERASREEKECKLEETKKQLEEEKDIKDQLYDDVQELKTENAHLQKKIQELQKQDMRDIHLLKGVFNSADYDAATKTSFTGLVSRQDVSRWYRK